MKLQEIKQRIEKMKGEREKEEIRHRLARELENV